MTTGGAVIDAASGYGIPAGDRSGLVSTRALNDATIWFIVFVAGFVIFEPAPYELLLSAIIPIYFMAGLKIRAAFGPLVVLLLVYMVGGVLSVTQVRPALLFDGYIYAAVSLFLCLSAIWWAALVAEDWRRIRVVEHATVATAAVVAVIGILGYFRLLPASDFFLLYGRARGTFQDPNVFGPFLQLPLLILARRLMVDRIGRQLGTVALLAVLLLAILLSFSRAAWGLVAVGLPLLAGLVSATLPTNRQRLRLVAIGFVGLIALALLLAVAVSIPAVSDLFAERAKLVQDYDGKTGAELGRFARHGAGFLLAVEKPLGIGPFEFPRLFIEATHNSYLKALMEYGWLGFVAYVTLVVWTLRKIWPLVFLPRPWQGFTQCLVVAFTLHLVMGWIIDTDHWRHFYMMLGMLWGLVAVERYHTAGRAQAA